MDDIENILEKKYGVMKSLILTQLLFHRMNIRGKAAGLTKPYQQNYQHFSRNKFCNKICKSRQVRRMRNCGIRNADCWCEWGAWRT